MIIGIGVDIFLFKRILNKNNFSLMNKISSLKKKDNSKFNELYIAKIFSIKESFVKSLGTGFREGFFLNNLTISNNLLKKPIINNKNKNLKILLSISHEKNSVVTFVVIIDLSKIY